MIRPLLRLRHRFCRPSKLCNAFHYIIFHNIKGRKTPFCGYYSRMGMNHTSRGAYEGGQGGEDDPFDGNPFIKAKMLGMDGSLPGTGTAPTEKEKPEHEEDDDMESILESKDDEDKDEPNTRTARTLIPAEPAQSTEDYGYEESLRKERIRNRIFSIVLTVITVIAMIALIWAICANPLHLFEGSDSGNGGYSEEYRGSGCRIDGQSCSSDDNGNSLSN